ncbi:MAG: DUF2304 domain-containing protein [Erysipelotrichales bacterium]|nr:DUF2304 domain-containing protein [Erysipelotrichales bacterium]
MEISSRTLLLFAIIIFIIVMLNFIKKDNVSIKYSLIWLISSLIVIVLILIPNCLEWMSHLLGFELISNMIFVIAILILFAICFSFTVIVTRETRKIRLLIQEISILKAKVESLEKKQEK